MAFELALNIIFKLLPVVVSAIRNGDNWQEIKLGDIEDLKTCKDLERELRNREFRNP